MNPLPPISTRTDPLVPYTTLFRSPHPVRLPEPPPPEGLGPRPPRRHRRGRGPRRPPARSRLQGAARARGAHCRRRARLELPTAFAAALHPGRTRAGLRPGAPGDRKSVGWGKSGTVRVELGGVRVIEKKTRTQT